MKTKAFNVVGIAREGWTPQCIIYDIECCLQDIASSDRSRRDSAAETIMHLCADILVIADDWVYDEGMQRVTPGPLPILPKLTGNDDHEARSFDYHD